MGCSGLLRQFGFQPCMQEQCLQKIPIHSLLKFLFKNGLDTFSPITMWAKIIKKISSYFLSRIMLLNIDE
jgi:hypothetical protein